MRRTTRAGAALALLVAGVLAGCGSEDDGAARADGATTASTTGSTTGSTAAGALLSEHGLADLAELDGAAVVDRLDRMPLDERPGDLMASVRDDELLLSSGNGAETAMPLPEETFYLSVAPYVDGTHECYFHSLTTCRGELGGERVEVTITDADGEVLVAETTEVFENGFVGFWLPDDTAGTVRVEHDGRVGEVDFATGPEDPTCLTTLRLS